jgi:hypothetical protein
LQGPTRFVAALVVVGLGTIAVLAVRNSMGDDGLLAGSACTASGTLEHGRGVVEAPGITPRLYPATAWTGRHLFLYGGVESPAFPGCESKLLNDSYLVDVTTGAAESLPAPPFEQPLSFPQVVNAGSTTIVVGALCGLEPDELATADVPSCEPGTYAAAAFDEKARSWRAVPLPASLAKAPYVSIVAVGATTSGDALFSLGDKSSLDIPVSEVWTFSPSSDQWTQTPSPGAAVAEVCLADDRLYAFQPKWRHDGRLLDASPFDLDPDAAVPTGPEDGYVMPSFAVMDLTASSGSEPSWRPGSPLPDVFLGHHYGVSTVCSAGHAIVSSQSRALEETYIYAAETDTWVTVPDAPGQFFVRTRVAAGSEILFLPSESQTAVPGLAFDLETRTWRSLDGLPPVLRGAVWAGDALVGYSEPVHTRETVTLPIGDERGPRMAPGVYHHVP